MSMSNCAVCCKPVESKDPILNDDDENCNGNSNHNSGRFITNIRPFCQNILDYDSKNQSEIRKLERKLSLCSSCSKMISAAVRINQDARDVERKVEKLQREILGDMKILHGKMLGFHVEMQKIKDLVRNTDEVAMTMTMKTAFEDSGRSGPEVETEPAGVGVRTVDTEIRHFRQRILSANRSLQKYISSIDSKFNQCDRDAKSQHTDTATALDPVTLKSSENGSSCKKITDHDDAIKGDEGNHLKAFKCLLCTAKYVTLDQLQDHLQKCDAKISFDSCDSATLNLTGKNKIKIFKPRGNHSHIVREERSQSQFESGNPYRGNNINNARNPGCGLGHYEEAKTMQTAFEDSCEPEVEMEPAGVGVRTVGTEIPDFRQIILPANQGRQKYISSIDSQFNESDRDAKSNTPTAFDTLTLKSSENGTSCKKIKTDHDDGDIKDEEENHLKAFECLLCATTFVTFDLFREHVQKCDAKISFDGCDSATLNLTGKKKVKITQHLGNHSHIARKERATSPTGGRKVNLQSHGYHGNNKKKNNAKIHDCLFCKKRFVQNSLLERHLITHIGERPFHCRRPNCSKNFTSKINLNNHQLSHSIERPFSCGKCQQRFKSKLGLRRHEVRHETGNFHRSSGNRLGRTRNRTNVKILDCLFCKKSFSRKENMDIHLRRHIEERPFHCRRRNCSKSFTSNRTLKAHQISHSNKKPFQCQQCQQRFKSLMYLRQHGVRRSHETGIVRRVKKRTWQIQRSICEFCGKHFQTMEGISRHIRAHLGEKPFKCGYPGCRQEFVDYYNLNKHRREANH